LYSERVVNFGVRFKVCGYCCDDLYPKPECNLPTLAVLLDNPRISASDSFTISIQLHTPVGPHFPQQPAAYYVPKDLLDGLEASLDNASKRFTSLSPPFFSYTHRHWRRTIYLP
jgi:hypothetical protein